MARFGAEEAAEESRRQAFLAEKERSRARVSSEAGGRNAKAGEGQAGGEAQTHKTRQI
jgi:hypothetical protein